MMSRNVARAFRNYSTNCKFKGTYNEKPIKRRHWKDEARLLTNISRALLHYDDLYFSVYGPKWPSLRLGLLSTPKYIAIPNSFTGDVDKICSDLEELGAYAIHPIWSKHKENVAKDRKEFNRSRDLKRVAQMERTMESIATTKQAEEMDVLYKNAPARKLAAMTDNSPSASSRGSGSRGRVLSDIGEAVVEHISTNQLKGVEDFQFDHEYYAVYNKNLTDSSNERTSPFLFTTQSNFTRLEFPPFLKPYTFEPGNPSSFPSSPRHSASGLRQYICINGASLVPVIALDLQPGINMLDLCAAPGTKSLLSVMTLTPASITCNDLESGRLSRVKKLFNEFLGQDSFKDNITTYRFNAADYPAEPIYDRVLADVPCLQDRVSCTVPQNNIFKPKRTKERLNLVKVQSKILNSAFKCLSPKPGSSCVYSTCSLSPVENDGAVMAALRETEVQNLAVDLMGLWNVLEPFQSSGLFYLSRTRFGYVIEPNIMSNYGPMYVSRIVVVRNNEIV